MFNNGQIVRDFTYVNVIDESLIHVLDKPAHLDLAFDPNQPNPATCWAPHRMLNIGNSIPTTLLDYIGAIKAAFGITATMQFLPI